MAYQKILQLSYIDKFLNDIHLEFRDKYKNDLSVANYFQSFNFLNNFKQTLKEAEKWGLQQAKAPKVMRSYDESLKSKKTVASMIERKGEEKGTKGKPKKGVVFQNGDISERKYFDYKYEPYTVGLLALCY